MKALCATCGEDKTIHARKQCAKCYYLARRGEGWWRKSAKAARALPRTCSICGRKTKKICLDHSHACPTGHEEKKMCRVCERGQLCRNCNLGLGLFRDNVEYLYSAVEYLDHWKLTIKARASKL